MGKTIFPAHIVSERIAQIRDNPPVKVGFFVYEYVGEKIVNDTIRWIDDDNGYIRIYKTPEKKKPYVVGGDTAGEGSDFFAAHVKDNVTGEYVAVLHHEFDDDLFARQEYCLGHYYNWALIGNESNFNTFANKELARLGYKHIYVREQSPDAYTGKLQPKYGFQTTKITRPMIISDLVAEVREHPERFYDLATLEEMLTFVRNEKGKAEAQEGKHDDLIMACAITNYISSQQSSSVAPDVVVIDWRKLPPDLLEDYRNATPEQRAYLLQKWGGGA